MMFQQLRNEVSSSSPAAQLHQEYARVSAYKSRIADWKAVLSQGISFDQAMAIIRFLENSGIPEFPMSSTIAKNAKRYLADAATDPVACRLPVSIEANELAERIAETGNAIDPEYVADALNRYRAYFVAMDPKKLETSYFDPPRQFVYAWFTEMMKYGSPRVRRFHPDHFKFKAYLRLVAQAARRG